MKEKIWAWLMVGGKIFKVITNSEKGTIEVYNQKGDLVKKDENLSKEAVNAVETNFLEIVATEIKGDEVKNEIIENVDVGMYIR